MTAEKLVSVNLANGVVNPNLVDSDPVKAVVKEMTTAQLLEGRQIITVLGMRPLRPEGVGHPLLEIS